MEKLEKEFLELEQGAILDESSISENDFLLGSVKNIDEYIKHIIPDKVEHLYNQAKLNRTRMACTLFGSFGAVSDLTGYKFSEKEILEICDIAEKKYGWSEKRGGWIFKGVDCVRNYWNSKNPDKELVSFRVDLKKDKELFEKLKKSGKTLVIGYKTTREHYIDSQDNGRLDKDCFVSCGSKILGGHCIRYNQAKNIDNYEGRKKFNIYENSKLVRLAKEGTYFQSAYVFFYKEDFKSIFKDVQEGSPFYSSIKWAKEKGLVHGYDDGTFRPFQNITRGELMLVLKNFNDFIENKKS